MDRSELETRLIRPGQARPVDDYERFTVQQRLEMMWPLALSAWEFMGDPVVEQGLPRHVVRVLRRGR